MIIEALAFYMFAAITVASAVMVIASRNPVHSVLFLIIVYVGAVAVLFLFVVMMLDINFVRLREGFLQYLPIGGLIGLIFLIELIMIGGAWLVDPEASAVARVPTPDPNQVTNTEALGRVIYTDFIYLFQAAGFILLVAMVGAIVLTLRQREGVKRQSIKQQVARRRNETVEVKDVPSGQGV